MSQRRKAYPSRLIYWIRWWDFGNFQFDAKEDQLSTNAVNFFEQYSCSEVEAQQLPGEGGKKSKQNKTFFQRRNFQLHYECSLLRESISTGTQHTHTNYLKRYNLREYETLVIL